jgi:hypothetical protein
VTPYNVDKALYDFLETVTQILKSLQPVIEHAVKEYLSEVKKES